MLDEGVRVWGCGGAKAQYAPLREGPGGGGCDGGGDEKGFDSRVRGGWREGRRCRHGHGEESVGALGRLWLVVLPFLALAVHVIAWVVRGMFC